MLGLYVHVPFCRSKCSYCDFASFASGNQKLYIDSLLHEIESRASAYTLSKKVDTVYIGGGTPSMLKGGYLTDIFAALRQNFDILSHAEITVEANPDSVTSQFVAECVALKVNRISLGLQSSNDKTLKAVNRPHTYNQFVAAVKLINSSGISNISADIMLGLPSEGVKDALNSINSVIDKVQHISMYALKCEQGTALYESDFILNEDLQADMYDKCLILLIESGFKRYEVSNFCKADNFSRHNYKYWTRENYFGFGLAAHSFDGSCRRENTHNISKYNLGQWLEQNQEIAQDDAKTEAIMLALRTARGLNLRQFDSAFNTCLRVAKQKEIDNLLSCNLIEIESDYLRLTSQAFYVMNSVIIKLI